MVEPLVSLEGVSFAFTPQETVLRDVTLSIPEGAILGVVGPSGCGKSTLLSIFAGLRRPGAGRITWHPSDDDRSRHSLTLVFQKDTLLPWLTAAENVALAFRFRASTVPRSEQRERVAQLMELAGLAGSEGKYPYQLSGGMRRRVAFLASIAPRPRTLLLDEPFSSLDEPTRVAIHQDVFRIVRQLRTTVVLVTHDLAEAISLSDEVAILTARPATVFTTHTVPFGRERDMLALRKTPEFLSLYGTLWDQLGQQLRRRPLSASADAFDG